jgi:hypothetical protein
VKLPQPGRYYDVNVHGTRTLLDAMVRAGVSQIVFSSSCAVYGTPDCTPIPESARLNPIDPYGFTKVVCERMMDDFALAHDGPQSARTLLSLSLTPGAGIRIGFAADSRSDFKVRSHCRLRRSKHMVDINSNLRLSRLIFEFHPTVQANSIGPSLA